MLKSRRPRASLSVCLSAFLSLYILYEYCLMGQPLRTCVLYALKKKKQNPKSLRQSAVISFLDHRVALPSVIGLRIALSIRQKKAMPNSRFQRAGAQLQYKPAIRATAQGNAFFAVVEGSLHNVVHYLRG